MGKLFEGIGQLVVGVNYLLSCYLMSLKFGFGWGAISFFIPPIGAVLAPFLVNTWGFFLVGAGFFIVGNIFENSEEKKSRQRLFEYQRSLDKKLADRVIDAEIVSRAHATELILGMQPSGPGKLFGSVSGELFWAGDSGYQFDVGKQIREWGFSKIGPHSENLCITLTTANEFFIEDENANQWKQWLLEHYPAKCNLDFDERNN